jgi:hypothetical protein
VAPVCTSGSANGDRVDVEAEADTGSDDTDDEGVTEATAEDTKDEVDTVENVADDIAVVGGPVDASGAGHTAVLEGDSEVVSAISAVEFFTLGER